jgi:hypothetical protein
MVCAVCDVALVNFGGDHDFDAVAFHVGVSQDVVAQRDGLDQRSSLTRPAVYEFVDYEVLHVGPLLARMNTPGLRPGMTHSSC